MSSSKPSSRRILSVSSKGNENAALNMAANTTSGSIPISTLTKGSSTSLRTTKSKMEKLSNKKPLGLGASSASGAGEAGKTPVVVVTAPSTSGKHVSVTAGTPKPKSKTAASKIPMRASCEDASDDHVNPNVYVSPPAPAGVKISSKPKVNSNSTYRDMPTSEIDMNPKSPKSPKTENNPTMTQSAPAKKKKKGKKKKKSKDVPPAKIRSPTQEEKQARMVELYKLYDNPFQKQYEKIREMELMAHQAGMDAGSMGLEKDTAKQKFEANLRECQMLEIDAHLVPKFEELLAQSRARGTALDVRPISDYLQAHSLVNVDAGGAAVGRAQDFWAEPNAVLGPEGKNLNNNFKAALDRAAGGKINTMAVVSGTGGDTNVLKADTNFGGKENKRAGAGSSTAKPALESGETIFDKLGEVISDHTIGKTNGKSPKKGKKKGVKVIKERVALIIENAVLASNNPEQVKHRLENSFPQPAYDDSWFTPDIISQIFKHPKLLAKKPLYGTDINTCTEYILREIYPMFHMHDDSEASKIHIWVNWVNGCAALWGLIGQKCCAMNYGGGFGLWSLSSTICVMVPEAARPGNEDFQMLDDTMSSLAILTLWFVEEYSWAYGDFKETMKSAEKVFPDDHSLIQAFGYTVGTKHLRFPAREKAIMTTIAQYSWFEAGADADADTDETENVQDALNTFKPNNTMTKYGRTIPEIMQSLQPILDGFCEVDDKNDEEQFATIATFLDGGTSLWNLIHLQVSKEEEATGKGLAAMQKAVWYAAGSSNMSMEERMNIVRRHTMWFITAWMKTGGDLKVIKEEALKYLPSGDDDLMSFMEKDRQHVKALLHPEKASVPALPSKPQAQTPTPMAATAPLPATVPKPLANMPKKAAKALQVLDVPPPAAPHTTPVRKRSQTLLNMPKGVQDFVRFLAVPSTSSATHAGSRSSSVAHVQKVVEAKAVEVTQSTAIAVSQKAVVTHVMAESKFGIPEVKAKVEAEEQDDFDVSHENMEYIAPSSVINTSASSFNIVSEGVENIEVNGAGNNPLVTQASLASSTANTSSSPTDRPSSVAINNQQNSSTDNKSDNVQNTIVPPTPPMTSEELSAHPDLHNIHNTLATLSSTLAAIHSALYGTCTSTSTSSAKTNIDTSTTDNEPNAELSANAHEAGLILITACLSTWLKDAQSQIAAVDSKVSALSTKIDDLQGENKVVKKMIEELAAMTKSGRGVEQGEGNGEGEKVLQVLLEEVRDVKEAIETLSRFKDGELNGEVTLKWLEKAKDLQGVIERAREAGDLREVLWPQGDGDVGFGAGGDVRAEVKNKNERGGLSGELREKVIAARELYVKIGNQAGRGQGGGGFCAVM